MMVRCGTVCLHVHAPPPPSDGPTSTQTMPAWELRSATLAGLGVAHAFTTRAGGLSRGMFSSQNFGNPGDLHAHERDPAEHIHEHTRALLVRLGLSDRRLLQVHQVHGAVVHVVRRESSPALDGDTKADAIVSDDPCLALGVRIADCAPILLASADGRVVAAVHAGWRGVIAGVLPNAVKAMRELGATGIVAAIGPCIGPEAMEVGPEVVAGFRSRFGDDSAVVCEHSNAEARTKGKGMVDLSQGLIYQLHECGVRTCDVTTARCTVRSTFDDGTPMFFSHRRDAGRTGRMIAVIGARA
jgi:polyphenol oxidase